MMDLIIESVSWEKVLHKMFVKEISFKKAYFLQFGYYVN